MPMLITAVILQLCPVASVTILVFSPAMASLACGGVHQRNRPFMHGTVICPMLMASYTVPSTSRVWEFLSVALRTDLFYQLDILKIELSKSTTNKYESNFKSINYEYQRQNFDLSIYNCRRVISAYL